MHIAVVLLLLLLGAPAPEEPDHKKMQGDWIVVSARTGNAEVDRRTKGALIRIRRSTLEYHKPSGELEVVCTFKIDAKQMPKAIDFAGEENGKKWTTPGIYAFDGEKLRLCWNEEKGGKRPTGFDQIGGAEEVRLYTLERKKD